MVQFCCGFIAGLCSFALFILWLGHRNYKQQIAKQLARRNEIAASTPELNDTVIVDAMAGGEMSSLDGVRLHGRQAVITDMVGDDAIIEVDGKRYMASLGLLKKITGSAFRQTDIQHSESPGDQQ